jgi:hypothetical protein
MKTNFSILSAVLALSGVLASSTGRAAVYTVPATANIHSSGLDVPIAPGGGGAGTLPLLHGISGGVPAFQFSAVGSVSQFYDYFYHGPDGLPGYSEDVGAYGGLSGFITDQLLPLAGVFLSDCAPVPPAPPTLNFGSAALGLDFLTLSPALGQVFFIGDGLTSAGAFQTFFVPAGATRLFLGFPDAVDAVGLPGAFADNEGFLTVTVNPVPEPGAATLALAGLAMLAGIRKTARAFGGR